MSGLLSRYFQLELEWPHVVGARSVNAVIIRYIVNFKTSNSKETTKDTIIALISKRH